MSYKTILTAFLFILSSQFIAAQQKSGKDTTEVPVIEYTSHSPTYEIAGITVSGTENYEDFVLIGFSGLSIGDKVEVPGPQITNAIKRFWKQGLFSDVKIYATKIKDNKIWLNIALKERPRISEINYIGLKKSEIDELDPKIGLTKGSQITPNISDRAKKVIEKFMSEKGFLNVVANVYQKNDPNKPGYVIVDINVDKKMKTTIHQLVYTGNTVLSHNQINRVMKKTNDNNWRNFFRTKKFVRENYEKDKLALIEKYNEIGYRDAYIVSDSVTRFNDKSVNVYIHIDEGKKYYFRNIKWVGNTIYSQEMLNSILGIKKGDVYNHKLLMERLETSETEAVSKLYTDRGYLTFHVEPVEVNVINDSIDLEMRMFEGKPYTISQIDIKGNTRVYEHVVRRELRTKPGQLFSREDIMRSMRELAQMGQFDPEKIKPDIHQPDQETGTVDITWDLETKGSDQVEFSAGWGATGLVGSIGLKFSNFAIQNLFKPETYRIVPQGEGQTFSLNARTNASSYTSFSLSFLEPWLGGKRPNSLSASIYYSTQSALSARYSQNMTSLYQSYYGYGMGGYGNDYNSYQNEIDPERYMRTLGASIGYGKRLEWPDDYFSLSGELSYQLYMLNNWYAGYFPMTAGKFNNLSLGITLNRNSVFNPIYPRYGSSFSLGLKITPPYSSFNGKKYTADMTAQERYKWLEYHKWTFTGKTFTPITSNEKLVLMGRVMFAYLGHYNENAQSPFETFSMGGDGMSSYTSYGTDYVAMRGYSSGSLTPFNTQTATQMGYLYDKFTMELRYPISLEQSATIYALTFLEAGNCFSSIKTYNPFNLKRTAGFGVRIYLPMFGMMGIDWGYGFDKDNTGKTSGGQFHFVLGQEL